MLSYKFASHLMMNGGNIVVLQRVLEYLRVDAICSFCTGSLRRSRCLKSHFFKLEVLNGRY